MKNTFGHSVTLTLFGESHGPGVGAVLDGIAPGLPVDPTEIARQLTRRRPSGGLDTPRQEQDPFVIQSGVWSGKTTGTPLCIFIPNQNTHSSDYEYGKARPSHADYAAFCKYHGFEDYRGGGHFSGRITAALTAFGGILLPALKNIGITLGTHIKQLGQVEDRPFDILAQDVAYLATAKRPVLSDTSAAQMDEAVLAAKAACDSLGGMTETVILGLPAGLGEPWFDSVEGLLSHALFSIGGIKAVSFGDGFDLCGMTGHEANDPLAMQGKEVVTLTNRNGGINGGITNGMPVRFLCGVKPTPSIAREQQTVDFLAKKDASLAIHGRHDPAIIRRMPPVIDSVCALVLADLIAQRFGTDTIREGLPTCSTD